MFQNENRTQSSSDGCIKNRTPGVDKSRMCYSLSFVKRFRTRHGFITILHLKLSPMHTRTERKRADKITVLNSSVFSIFFFYLFIFFFLLEKMQLNIRIGIDAILHIVHYIIFFRSTRDYFTF